MENNFENRLGEVVEIESIKFQVVEGNICPMCSLNDENINIRYKRCASLNCSKFSRRDKKDVVYIKLNED